MEIPNEIKCRKPPLRLVIEAVAAVVIGFVLLALAIVIVQGWFWLTLLVSLSFLGFEVVALALLLKNAPMIILNKGTLGIRCRRLPAAAVFFRTRWLEIPLGKIERVWVGKSKDYAFGLLCRGFDSRCYPDENTMVFWIKDDPELNQIREFSWLTNTTQLLGAIATANIPIQGKYDV